MKERIIIQEQLRQPHSDFNVGVHGFVDEEQNVFTGTEPKVEIYVLSEKEAGAFSIRKTEEIKAFAKGGDIFHGTRQVSDTGSQNDQ